MPYEVRYVGPSLASLVNEQVTRETDRLMRSISEQARDTMFTVAQAATPRRYGTTANSWVASPVKHRGDVYEAKVSNSHWVAFLLEHGVQEHEIFPEHRRAEMTPLGPRASAHHPGFRAHRMTQAAADTVRETISPLTWSARERWKREAELGISLWSKRLKVG